MSTKEQDKKQEDIKDKKDTKAEELLAKEELVSRLNLHLCLIPVFRFRARRTKHLRTNWNCA